ncbi:MAG TPA: discoidin domain-containing protein [Polyangia bacterium]|nr:discoidin domain-containing protein [Polyangia bacterium]
MAGLFVLVVSPFLARAAHAEDLSSPPCGTENLLAGRLPSAQQDMRGNLSLITDESVGPEGAQWDAPVAAVFETGAGSVTYDLGQARPVSAFVFQGDANDTYKIFGSLDGTPGSFKVLAEIENVVSVGHGLRTRPVQITSTVVRYLRIGEGLGDSYYSIAEFAAYCQAPNPFPPSFKKVDAPPAKVNPPGPWAWWDNDASSRFEMGLAFAALALVGWGVWLARRGMANRFRKTRDGLLMLVGALSFLAYWNFFSFHFGNYFHVWDTYHYYIGSKYFKELSYDRLYECASVADSEDPSLRRRVELRKIMNLHTNMMESTSDLLAHPERCKSHFTPERWEAFKEDIKFFRLKHGIKRWEDAQTDHGYNATPVWNILGTLLSNTGPATEAQVEGFLIKIDPFFIVGMCLMTWWAFGWRTMCVSLAVFATSFPNRFYWTGGSFLRWDWLFYFVSGVCLVRKEKMLAGGLFLGYSTLLRVFPGFIFTAPAFVIIQQLMGEPSTDRPWWKPAPFKSARELYERIDKRWIRLFAGAAIAVAVLVPLSLVTSNGLSSYVEFRANSKKHVTTPLTNYMGLKTVAIYRPSEAGRVLKDDKLEDPWRRWKETKVSTYQKDRWILHVIAIFGFWFLMWKAVRKREPWVVLSMGAMTIAMYVELTCYYYAFMFVVAFLWQERKDAGAYLLAAMAATGFIDWAPTKYLPNTPPWDHLRMPQWLDEQYTWMSVAILVAFAWILYRFAYPESLPDLAVAGGVPLPEGEAAKDDEADAKRAPAKPRASKNKRRRR